MKPPDPRDEALLAAIESGKLDGPLADDPEVVEVFAAYRKLQALFAKLRQAEPLPRDAENDAPSFPVGGRTE